MRRPRPNAGVAAWISATSAERLFLSAVTLGELQAGVEMTLQQHPSKAKAIKDRIYAAAATQNVLPADGVIFRRWAQLTHRRSDDLIQDALIAATALVHNLTVVTRNLRDFERLGVATVNPFRRPDERFPN